MRPVRPTDVERALLRRIGSLAGKNVLEVGCGDGSLTLHLLARGASVTALDISAGMVRVAQERAERFRPESDFRFVVAPAEATGLAAGRFDVVVGKWVLHHLDLAQAAQELARVLRPGGTGLFMETSALNPVLNWARQHLAGRFGVVSYGTPDEHPLDAAALRELKANFSRVYVSFPVFRLFLLIDSHVFRGKLQPLTGALWLLDQVAALAPGVRRYSYQMLIRVER
jgi:ubiquinone/menaquinone biosynthesis C-methylase UbiE